MHDNTSRSRESKHFSTTPLGPDRANTFLPKHERLIKADRGITFHPIKQTRGTKHLPVLCSSTISIGQGTHLGIKATTDRLPDQVLAYLGCLDTAGVLK